MSCLRLYSSQRGCFVACFFRHMLSIGFPDSYHTQAIF